MEFFEFLEQYPCYIHSCPCFFKTSTLLLVFGVDEIFLDTIQHLLLNTGRRRVVCHLIKDSNLTRAFLHLVTKPGIEKRTESNDRGRGQTCRLRSKFANNWCFGEESLKPEFDGVNASLSPASGIRNQIPQYWSMQYFIGVGHILSLFS